MTTTTSPTWFFLLGLAACSRVASSGDDPPPQPPEPPKFERPEIVRLHMKYHLGDLRAIERLLVGGKLEDAKARAALLAEVAPDPGLAPWSHDVEAVSAAARELGSAPSIDEALRREARLAEACGFCHLHVQKVPIFAQPQPAPPDEPTRPARMARHQWAADRLWEGIVGASDRSWRDGLEVLASTPLPFSPLTDAPGLAATLQELARTALVKQRDPRELPEDRARLYGEMLVTCAACHASTRK